MRIATVKSHHKCCQCDSSFENGQQGYMMYIYIFCSKECMEKWVYIGREFSVVEIELEDDAE